MLHSNKNVKYMVIFHKKWSGPTLFAKAGYIQVQQDKD